MFKNSIFENKKNFLSFLKYGTINTYSSKGVNSVNNKQILAALEIADHELRLIVGEFFNTRFNVIKVERVQCSGVESGQIIDSPLVSETIKKMVASASEKIGAKIEKVLLCVPSIDAERIGVKVNVRVDSIDKKITILDIRNAVKKAMSTPIDEQYALINAVCVRYTCNGITTRRRPVGEIAEELTVHLDLLCASRQIAFDYVTCVENAKLQILDISLDSFAVAKEACLFEQAVDQNIIVLKLERESTAMALLHEGRFASCDVISQGMGSWIAKVTDQVHLPLDISSRLVNFNGRIRPESCKTSPIYIWSMDGVTSTISEQELCDMMSVPAEKWIEEIRAASEPIIASGKTTVVLTGEGAEIEGLAEALSTTLGCTVKRYFPETLGVRSSALTSVLGMFYVYADTRMVLGDTDSCVNMEQFTKSVQVKPIKTSDENTITNKLKNILFDNKDKD